jgi:hypothetical protein
MKVRVQIIQSVSVIPEPVAPRTLEIMETDTKYKRHLASPLNTMRPSRHHYHRLSPSKRQQRHYCYYATLAVVVILSVLYLAITVSNVRKYPPLSLPPDSSRGSRCSDSPADCETTAPFIFDSIYSLAKQWPSTYAPNGHSIVPVTFPRNMPLYHANHFEGEMQKQTWFAFDA